MILEQLINQIQTLLTDMDVKNKIAAINQIKKALNKVSPFKDEPIDCVQWIPADSIDANDYNPNHVAPPEKRLLYTSLVRNGFTQPVVVWHEKEQHYTIVDGFHRYELAQKRKLLHQRLQNYLPVVLVNTEQSGKDRRIASTIQHNRARGQHQVQAMSVVVQELARLGWSDDDIGVELGMDNDEVLRLKQISGLAELFQKREFSQAWTSS